MHICETYTVMTAAVKVANKIVEEMAMNHTRGEEWSKGIKITPERVAGAAAHFCMSSAMWTAVGEGAIAALAMLGLPKQIAEDAARDAARTGDWRSACMDSARVSLKSLITHEQFIYRTVPLILWSIKMPATVDRRSVIDTMLNLDIGIFGQMNVGGKCWYFSRVWSLMGLTPPAAAAEQTMLECKETFFSVIERCKDPVVSSFVVWITGPGFSRAELVMRMQSSLRGLCVPLWEIVYDYLAAPPADLIRQEILRLI